ncbi:PREDICTED: class II histocompatibility antigen, M alpha chain [Gekko japonicus]|uniref:Class II histocompatibility antigen, M alpha chain n=1 Tax=Gekko japonicus TaxID=146911 RepID=A0ABM1KH65_GEKJA|nr:PREDICTED: class II histocompatibility antigen, M alpha chain [Gekko japonicus]
MGSKRCNWGLGVWAWLWGAAAAAASLQEEPIHWFSQVFFCQRDSPFFGLAQGLDDDQLFWFDFPNSSWHARLPDFDPEVPSRVPTANVSAQRELCRDLLTLLSNISNNPEVQLPESKGIPQVEVFTRYPLELGKPNTLICSVSNLFPPSATIAWAWNGEPVTQGVSTTQVYPVGGLDFELFSYLEVTPWEGDVYSCSIQTPGDFYNGLAYWVPRDPVPSDFLETLVCGVAIAVGILLVILGILLIVKSRMPRNAE